MAKRPEQDYYCPACADLVRYMGFYRCTGCGRRVDLGDLITAEAAARVRAARMEEVTCDALF